MAKGQVYKIHSDFYYVKVKDDVIECKLREIFKKQKKQVLTGDFVEVQDCVITKIFERKNIIKRPAVANLDMLIVVCAVKEPDLDFIQLNRYLTFAKINKIDAVMCFNKEDLSNDEYLKEQIYSIYKPLGYKILFTSALEKTGLSEFKTVIKGKMVALCGQSGVGKSSLLNALKLELNLKTGKVSKKNERGTHTTRHVEILEFDDFSIADTPGFSCLKFDFILPMELGDYFDEIKKYKKNCKFKDCLHTEGSRGCAVLENIDDINISRYESYLKFLKEAQDFKEKVKKQGQKKEATHKKTLGKDIAKITAKKRESARNTQKQRIESE